MAAHSLDTKREDHLTEDQVETAIKELSKDDRIAGFTAAEQKRIVRRIDLRLAFTLGCLYCISLLDRTNLRAASVAGYARLSLTPSQANCQSGCRSV